MAIDSQSTKLFVLGISLLGAGAIGTWVWRNWSREGATVELVDTRRGLIKLLAEAKVEAEQIPELSLDELVMRPAWTQEIATQFYPAIRRKHTFSYDSILGARRLPGLAMRVKFDEHPKGGILLSTNSLGLRDDELLAEPDLRILVAGDSQTEGVCSNSESFVNLLEDQLVQAGDGQAIEVINAALGGVDPWYYLTTLEAFGEELRPDVFVAVFFGGNDFRGSSPLERYYRGRGLGLPTDDESMGPALVELPGGIGPVELQQIRFFLDNPDDQAVVVKTWAALAMEMQRQCQALGIDFVPVYMPPPIAGQLQVFEPVRRQVEDLLPEIGATIDLTNDLADEWIAMLAERGVEVADLRSAFAEAKQSLFWKADHHLNLEGQAKVADALGVLLGPLVKKHLAD